MRQHWGHAVGHRYTHATPIDIVLPQHGITDANALNAQVLGNPPHHTGKP